MISIPITELTEYLNTEIQSVRDTIDNEVEQDTLTSDKAIRLSTKIKAFNILKAYINLDFPKEEQKW